MYYFIKNLHCVFPQVLTFDGRGVSGHANHIAIYKTLRYPCADVIMQDLPPQQQDIRILFEALL